MLIAISYGRSLDRWAGAVCDRITTDVCIMRASENFPVESGGLFGDSSTIPNWSFCGYKDLPMGAGSPERLVMTARVSLRYEAERPSDLPSFPDLSELSLGRDRERR